MGEKLYIVIPAYNEEVNIEKVVNDWYPIVEKYGKDSRLLVIDDGSKDHTYQKLVALARNREALDVKTKKNSGHGATVLYGYNYALTHGADYIFQTDSDGQTNAEEFAVFWKKRDKYEMIIGDRNHRKDGISRIFVTKVLQFVLRVMFGVWVPDANTPFRLMKSETLAKCLTVMPREYNLPNVIISVIGVKKRKKILYIPITFQQRQGGVNSINLKSITRIGFQAVKDFRIINQRIAKENI